MNYTYRPVHGPRVLIPARQLDERIARQVLPLALLFGGRGRPGADGARGLDGIGADGTSFGPRIEATAQPSTLSGSTLKHFTGPNAITGSSSAAWRVRAAPGSSWRVRVATDGTIAAGETLTLAIYQSLTPDGTYSVISGSAAALTDADGADPEELGAIVVPTARWLTLGVSYTAVAAWAKSVYCALERVG